MTNTTSNRALRVSDGGEAGPYIRVPLAQLEDLRQVLDRDGLDYWVDEVAISLDRSPPVIVVNFSPGVDPAIVQRSLDEAP